MSLYVGVLPAQKRHHVEGYRMRTVYLDYAATSPVRPEVLQAMLPYFSGTFGNASSLHMAGQRAKRALEEARQTIAGALGANPREIIFTSGGTESNNLAIKGLAYASRHRGRHLITSAIEHHSVLNVFHALEAQGFEVTYVPVDRHGIVDLYALEESIRDETCLISVMLANNEIGTIEPISDIVAIAKERGIFVHTDAIQAVGKMRVNVNELGVDLLSLTGHKIYGPKGAGALYVRAGTPLVPLLHGGHQEHVIRPGTENIPGIVGLATAARLACAETEQERARIGRLRDRLEAGIRTRIPDVTINGQLERRLPHISNVSFAHVEGESLLLALDTKGIAVSTGSACQAGATEPSHVLQAMGIEPALARGTLRFSLGRETTEEDIDYVVEALAEIVGLLRSLTIAYEAQASVRNAMVGG